MQINLAIVRRRESEGYTLHVFRTEIPRYVLDVAGRSELTKFGVHRGAYKRDQRTGIQEKLRLA
jgi:hypothetical protein